MAKSKSKFSAWKKRDFVWVTLIFFAVTVGLHWLFGWEAFRNEQIAHGQAVNISDYTIEMMRDTFENWQSEFLQLIWQVAGLSFLYYIGSTQSREGEDRKEEKLDYIIRQLDPDNANKLLKDWEEKYPKH
jgi:hypothetical protein